MREVDVGQALDAGAWTGFQKVVLTLTSIAILLDGFDNQLIGIAIPALMLEWGLERGDFVPVVALGLVSMSIGAAGGGAMGDRFGRKPLLIGSVALFGGSTAATAAVDSLDALLTLRLIAALGLGAAFPNVTALASEFSPTHRRSIAVSIAMLSMPIGGLCAGSLSAFILPEYGWRPLFVIGGVLPLISAVAMWLVLPESPRYLVHRPARRSELLSVLRRCGVTVDQNAELVDRTAPVVRASPATVLEKHWRRDTLALWLAFFAGLFANYMAFSWAPTMVHELGFDLAIASTGLAAYNLGGIAGALTGAWLMDRNGSRGPIIALGSAGLLLGVGIGFALDASLLGAPTLIAAFAAQGFCIAGLQTLLFALGAHVYPAGIRATGSGLALAVGRVGGITSAAVGAAILGFSDGALFYAMGAGALVAVLAVLLVRGHTVGAAARPISAALAAAERAE